MRPRNRYNAVLLVAAIALGVLAWLQPAAEREAAGGLTGLTPGEVQSIRVEFPASGDSGQRSLRLERRADGWYLTAPIERAARDGRIVTALRILSAPTDSCYELARYDAARFGLDTPRMRLYAGGVTIGFGDRAADGRRYIRIGGRVCLVADRSYPLFARGVEGLALPALIRAGAEMVRIETPHAVATRPNTAARWSLRAGEGAAQAWAFAWRAARARDYRLDPPDGSHGTIQIETADGTIHRWRIAQPPPKLILVPFGADYGLVVAHGDELLRPPERTRDAPKP